MTKCCNSDAPATDAGAGAPEGESRVSRENDVDRLARAILWALREENPRVFVEGGWEKGERTIIDGRFDLWEVAKRILSSVA